MAGTLVNNWNKIRTTSFFLKTCVWFRPRLSKALLGVLEAICAALWILLLLKAYQALYKEFQIAKNDRVWPFLLFGFFANTVDDTISPCATFHFFALCGSTNWGYNLVVLSWATGRFCLSMDLWSQICSIMEVVDFDNGWKEACHMLHIPTISKPYICSSNLPKI